MKPLEKRNITKKDMKPENERWNITMRVSGDLIQAYKAEAKKLGIGYQTLMQIKLRKALIKMLQKKNKAKVKR